MKTLLKFVCVIAVLSVAVAVTDYCQLSCGRPSDNIGCGNDKSFKASCPRNAEVVPLTERIKQIIVDIHNEKRDFIAGGGDANHDPACHMSALQWDADLAELAELNVKQCDANHDFCHRTERFEIVGQNIALHFNTNPNADFNIYFSKSVEGWYNEVGNSNKQIIKFFPNSRPPPSRLYGHFTLMMVDRVTHVGCAAVRYTSDKPYFLFTCNYSYNNIAESSVYEACSSPAQSCPNGKHSTFKNLCA